MGVSMATASVAALMRHHAWAVRRLLDTAAAATNEQLSADSEGRGSIFATLRHIADVDQSWGRVARGELDLSLDQVVELCPDLSALRAFWLDEVAHLVRFAGSLTPEVLEREVQPPWNALTVRVWQVLWHITDHRAEHGGEVGWRLTALGHSPGELGFMYFVVREQRGEA